MYSVMAEPGCPLNNSLNTKKYCVLVKSKLWCNVEDCSLKYFLHFIDVKDIVCSVNVLIGVLICKVWRPGYPRTDNLTGTRQIWRIYNLINIKCAVLMPHIYISSLFCPSKNPCSLLFCKLISQVCIGQGYIIDQKNFIIKINAIFVALYNTIHCSKTTHQEYDCRD